MEAFILTLLHYTRLGQKSWKKSRFFFWDLKTPKWNFEITWPLTHTFIWSLHFYTVTGYRYEMSEALSLSGTGNYSINPVTSHCHSKFRITRYLYILVLHTYKYHGVNHNWESNSKIDWKCSLGHLPHYLGMNFYSKFLGRLGSNEFQLIYLKVWQPWQLKKSKSWGPFRSY